MNHHVILVLVTVLVLVNQIACNCFRSVSLSRSEGSSEPAVCDFRNQIYNPGDTWLLSPCMNCTCHGGGDYECCGYGLLAGPGFYGPGCDVSRIDCYNGELVHSDGTGSCADAGRQIQIPKKL